MTIYDCIVNHLDDPLGYQLDTPVFSWQGTDTAVTKQAASGLVV